MLPRHGGSNVGDVPARLGEARQGDRRGPWELVVSQSVKENETENEGWERGKRVKRRGRKWCAASEQGRGGGGHAGKGQGRGVGSKRQAGAWAAGAPWTRGVPLQGLL